MNEYLNDNEEGLLKTSLRAAAERWDEWSLSLALPRVAEQFAAQAKAARDLADKLDLAAGIKVIAS